jgi:hypothetical protein
MKKLRDVETARQLPRVRLLAGAEAGSVAVAAAAELGYDLERLAAFLSSLPRTMAAA